MASFDQTEEIVTENQISKIWFLCTILFLIIDYGRPQDTFRIIGYIRPAMIATIFLVIYLIRNKSIIPRNIIQTRLIWLFIFILALHIPFARNNRFAYNTTIAMVLNMPFILSCYTCINTFARFRQILFIAICLMVYQGQFSIAHGGHGNGGIFLDENDLSLFINTWLPFSFACFLSVKNLWKKIFYGMCTAIGVASVVVSFSRGGFLGLIGMFVVNWIFSPRKLLTLGILILGAITVFIVSDLTSHGKITHQKKQTFWSEMSSSTDSEHGTARDRIESWKAGWRMFLANPLGVGGNNYQVRFPDYQDNTYFKRGMWGRVAHSLWFTLFPETGIPGVVIYGLLIFFNIKATFFLRKYASNFPEDDAKFLKNIFVAFLASFAGFFASATFLSVLYYPHFWYVTGLLVSITLFPQNSIITETDVEELNVVP